MKILLLLVVLASCASKYETHNTVDKRSFKLGTSHNAMKPRAVRGAKEQSEFCSGQIFFSSNAKKDTDQSVPTLLSRICPGETFLLDAKVTETWWTTLVYSRSCIKIEAHCPRYYK